MNWGTQRHLVDVVGHSPAIQQSSDPQYQQNKIEPNLLSPNTDLKYTTTFRWCYWTTLLYRPTMLAVGRVGIACGVWAQVETLSLRSPLACMKARWWYCAPTLTIKQRRTQLPPQHRTQLSHESASSHKWVLLGGRKRFKSVFPAECPCCKWTLLVARERKPIKIDLAISSTNGMHNHIESSGSLLSEAWRELRKKRSRIGVTIWTRKSTIRNLILSPKEKSRPICFFGTSRLRNLRSWGKPCVGKSL